MIDATFLDSLKLKRVNVSTDKQKTKERIETIWSSNDRSKKRSFFEETNELERTVYRIRREGAIIPKMAILLSEYFDCDPSYLTADIDGNNGWSDEAMNSFLESKGYSVPVAEPAERPKRKYTKRQRKAEVIVDEATESPDIAVVPDVPESPEDSVDSVDSVAIKVSEADEAPEAAEVFEAAKANQITETAEKPALETAVSAPAAEKEPASEESCEQDVDDLSYDDLKLLLKALLLRAKHTSFAKAQLKQVISILLS